MKRRQVIRSILTLPAITALPAAAQAPEKTPQAQQKLPPEVKPPGVEEVPKLAMTNAEAVTEAAPRFFTPDQFRTLERLCNLLVPAMNVRPGAKEAAVAPFLDFLVQRSPQDQQALYQSGLDRLNTESHARFKTAFAEISAPQASDLLAPLATPWTFQGPSNELARFLAAVKDDALRATVNSREWAESSSGRRGGRGIGAYWYSLE